VRVYIPSRGRADERLLRGPVAQFPPDVSATYVVGADELAAYAVAISKYQIAARVIACPHQPSIALTRQWCGEHAARFGADQFCLMDDDVNILVRIGADTWQLERADQRSVKKMLTWMRIALRVPGVVNVGISGREGNNRAGLGYIDSLSVENTRIMRVQAFRTAEFLACEHGRVRVLEDFDITLQLLRAGYSNVVSYWWAQGQRMTNEQGGCSEWRTHEVHEESARRLGELHPGIVTLRQKQNKTDHEGFGTRTEVTVQWKTAHAEGQRRVKAAAE
jgi:hypothetical protein